MVVGFGGGVAMLGKVLYSVLCISYKYIILIFTNIVLHLQYIMNLKPIKDLGTSIEVIYENILLLCCIIFLFVFIKLKLTLEFVNNIIIYKLKCTASRSFLSEHIGSRQAMPDTSISLFPQPQSPNKFLWG